MVHYNDCRKSNVIYRRVNKYLMESETGKSWRTITLKKKQNIGDSKTNKRINTLPKVVRMMGRLAKKPRVSKVNSYVYIAHKEKLPNGKFKIHFVIKECDNILHDGTKCNGKVKHDEYENKVCTKCGMMFDEHLPLIYYNNLVDDVDKKTSTPNYGKYAATIQHRNKAWEELDFEEYLRASDEGTDELKDRYARVKEFEKTWRTSKQA